MQTSLRKFRFGFRLLTAFWQKHRRLILAGVLVGAFFFSSLPKFIRSSLSTNTQKIGLVGKHTPAELPLEIQCLISHGLTLILPNGEAVPSLAASWEVNNEGKEYIFTLQDNIVWQTGRPVSAGDINYNFNDVAPTVIDEKKIKFELKEPFIPFPAVVARPIFKKGLIGTGPYQVKTLKENGQIIETLVLKPVKNKSEPTLIFRFYPTESAARTGFKLGEVNTLREIVQPKELAAWSGVKITSEIRYNRFAGIFFNTEDPKLGHKSLRQALAYGIDKNWESRAYSSINPHSWAYNAKVKSYDFDFAKAKELLEKVAKENEGSLLEEIELSTTPLLLSTAEKIKSDWEKLDIKVKIKIINSLDQPFEALLIVQEIPPDPDQYFLWHSTQMTNLSRYKSPKLDKLLEDGRKTLDQEKRKEIYHDFQRFLVEDTPAIFLFHPTVYAVSKK